VTRDKSDQNFKIVNTLDEELWRQFVDQHPQGSVFHTPEMSQVFARAKGHQPTLWAAVDHSNRPLALLLPVQIRLMDGLLRRFSTRVVAYSSVLCAPGLKGKEALEMLLRVYKQEVGRRVLFTELRNLSDMSAVQPVLNGCGFVYEDHLNYLIDLDSPVEAIMQSIGKRTRKKIRRQLRRNEVTIEEVTRREQLIPWYTVLQQTYNRAQVPLADRPLFEAAFDVLHPRGMAKFLVARVDQTYAAVSAELLYKDVVYGWYGGMDRAYSNFYPNELLTWHILQWGAEHGYKVYDFGGAGRPQEEYSVRNFKAKFGGELVCYGRNICVYSQMRLKLSKLGYTAYRMLAKVANFRIASWLFI
jgi:serine/alanine adding enzyme